MVTIAGSGSGEDEVWLLSGYDGGVGGHGPEGFRVEGERGLITSSHLGRERLSEWDSLLHRIVEGENEELGVIRWDISGLKEPATTSTILDQLTTTSDLNEVADVLGANTHIEGLLERRIVWGEDP